MNNKQKSKGLVPRLRFPEFRDAEPWKVKRLGALFFERSERGSNEFELLSVTISDGVVRTADLERKNKSNADLSNYKKVYPGDIVYNSMRMWQGASGVSWWHGVVSPAYTVVTPNESQNVVFWAYTFKLDHAITKFARFSQGITSDTWNLKYPAFSAIEMAFPSEQAEQQRIADCLSSLDDLIAAEGRKLEALRAHKKGLMQQLFPREGETVPRLRFPGFEGEWEEKPLNKVAEIIKGRGISKSDIVAKGKTPCIRYGELYTTYGEIIEDVVSRTNLTEDNLILSRKGDVLIPSSGETKEEIATCACVQKNGIALGSDLNIIRSTLDGRFLAYYIKVALQNTLAKLAQGDAVVHLYPNQLKGLKIQIPKIKEEQQRIADCLSSLDDLISAEGRKLEALRAHKNGLMQQMFPTLKDVEG